MLRDSLEHLGLSVIEVSVFLAILDHHPCHIIKIFKATGKHRQVIYNALDTLIERGLVSVSKKHGKNLYTIGDPHTLLIDIKQKEVLAQEVVRVVKQKLAPDEERVETFTGADSYARAMESFRLHAENAQEFIVFGGQRKEWFSFTQAVFDHHVSELRRMKRTGTEVLVLYFHDEWENTKNFFSKYIKDPYTVKVLNSSPTLPHPVWLAGDHLYILTPVTEPIIIHLTSAELSKKYHNYFWESWKAAEIV